MKRFFQTIKNIFSIEDLRIRILNTIGFLIIFRLGSFIVIPGIDPNLLDPNRNSGGILGYLNNFLGGAFNNAPSLRWVSCLTFRLPSLFSCFLLQFLIFRNFRRKVILEENV